MYCGGAKFGDVYKGVSKSKGTPKSSVLIGFSIINHPFWGNPIFGTPISTLRICIPVNGLLNVKHASSIWETNFLKRKPDLSRNNVVPCLWQTYFVSVVILWHHPMTKFWAPRWRNTYKGLLTAEHRLATLPENKCPQKTQDMMKKQAGMAGEIRCGKATKRWIRKKIDSTIGAVWRPI